MADLSDEEIRRRALEELGVGGPMTFPSGPGDAGAAPADDAAPPVSRLGSILSMIPGAYERLMSVVGIPKQYVDLAAKTAAGDEFGLAPGNEAGQLLADEFQDPAAFIGSAANRVFGRHVLPGVVESRERDQALLESQRAEHPTAARVAEGVSGFARGAAESLGGLATDPAAALIPETKFIGGALFLPGMLQGVYQKSLAAKAALDQGDIEGAGKLGGGAVVDAALAGITGLHLVHARMASSADPKSRSEAELAAEAATSGTGAMLTRGLTELVNQGKITYEEAVATLRAHAAQAAGLEDATGQPTSEEGQAGEAGAAPLQFPTGPEGAAATPGGALEGTATPAPTPAPVAAPPAALEPPTLNLEGIHPNLAQVIQQKQAAGGPVRLTLNDLKQAAGLSVNSKKGSFQSLMERLGAAHLAGQFQKREGGAYEMQGGGAEGVAGVLQAAEQAGAGGVAPAGAIGAAVQTAPAPAVEPLAEAPTSPAALPSPGPDTAVAPGAATAEDLGAAPEAAAAGSVLPTLATAKPGRITTREIDAQLADPGVRTAYEQRLVDIAAGHGIPVDEVTKDDIRETHPSKEEMPVRAALYRIIEARKKVRAEAVKAARAAATAAGAPRVDASLTRKEVAPVLRADYPPKVELPTEETRHEVGRERGMEPRRTPADVISAAPPSAHTGEMTSLEKLREPTGIGRVGWKVGDKISNVEQLQMSEERYGTTSQLEDLPVDLLIRRSALGDRIAEAYARGVGADRPEPRPVKPEYPGEMVDRRTVEREVLPPEQRKYKTQAEDEEPPAPVKHPPMTGVSPKKALTTAAQALGAAANDTGVSLASLQARVEELVGKPVEQMTEADNAMVHGAINQTINEVRAERGSILAGKAQEGAGRFGAKTTRLTTEEAQRAAGRLVGTHAGKSSGRGGGVMYDRGSEDGTRPPSPAAKAQEMAQQLEASYGMPAEENLQDTIVKWLDDVNKHPDQIRAQGEARAEDLINEREDQAQELEAAGHNREAELVRAELQSELHGGKGVIPDPDTGEVKNYKGVYPKIEESIARAANLRRLLLEDDPKTARVELEKLLKDNLSLRRRTFVKRRVKLAASLDEADDAVAPTAVENLTPAERDRLVAGLARPLDILRRPAGVGAKEWNEQLRSNKKLAQDYANAIMRAANRQVYTVDEARTGAARASKTDYMQALADAASDRGLTLAKKISTRDAVRKLVSNLHPDVKIRTDKMEPRASATSELLTDQLVAKRGDRYQDAVRRGQQIADTGTRAVDFENDAPVMTRMLARISPALAEHLSRLTSTMADLLKFPTRFAGYIASPQLDGLRLGSDAYLNPLHLRHQALEQISAEHPELAGQQLTDAQNYRTAELLVDKLGHELAHHEARHESSENDSPFLSTYARAIKELGAQREEMIRQTRDAIEAAAPELDRLMPDYARSFTAHKEAASAARPAGQADVDRSRPGSDQAQAPGPGGDQGGFAGVLRGGIRPIRDLPGGAQGAAEAVGSGAAAGEGRAAEPAAGAGGAGGPGSGEPAASLTVPVPLTPEARRSRIEETLQQVGRLYASTLAKYSKGANAATFDEHLANINKVLSLPEDKQALLRAAKPQGAIDIGANMGKYADALSDEQLMEVALGLQMRNATFDRSRTMHYDEVDADMRSILKTKTPEEFEAAKKRTGLQNPADFAFVRTMFATFGRDVDTARADLRAAEIAKDPAAASAAKQAGAYALMRRDAMMNLLVPNLTNVGRILAFQRHMIHPLGAGELFEARFKGAMKAARIPKDKIDGLYSMLQDTLNEGSGANWERFAGAFREATQPKMFDKFIEFWKAGLLGIPTQIANIGTNATFLGYRNVENGVSVLANNFFSGLQGKPRERYVAEIGGRLNALKTALPEAFRMLGDDAWSAARLETPDIGERMARGTFFDEPDIRQLQGAIGGKTGEFVRLPFKSLDSWDNFFKHLSRNQEFAAQAVRLANKIDMRSPGEAIDHASSRIFAEIRSAASNPVAHYAMFKKYRSAIEAANDTARADTFQTPLPDAARKLYQGTQAHPALQFLFPFWKTPYNVLAEGLRRTPLAAMNAIYKYKRGEITDSAFVDNMTKSAMGSIFTLLAAQAALSGTLTGGGPPDPRLAEEKKRTGWQPYSIKTPAGYVSYARLEPFSTILGLGGDIGEAWKNGDIDSPPKLMDKAVSSWSNLVKNKSMLQGLGNLVDIISDPQRKGQTAIRSLQASLVPNVVGVVPVGHLTRAIDPTYRETEALTLSPFLAQIPGLSETLPPQMTPTGEERRRLGSPLERLISPLNRSPERTDDIATAAEEMSRLGYAPQAVDVSFKVGNERVYYTPEERQAIAESQERAMEKVARLVSSPGYDRLPDSESVAQPGARTKLDAIKSILSRYHTPIAQRMNQQALRRAREDDRMASS